MTHRKLIESLLAENAEMRRQLHGLGIKHTDHGAREAAYAALAALPDWHERPTMPGYYLCDNGRLDMLSLHLTARDIERGAPFHVSRVYGPIPPAPETTKQ